MLKQGLHQKLLQKLSPQQIQFIKLLQIPTVELEARIKQELEDNPALAEGMDLTADEQADANFDREEDENEPEREDSYEEEGNDVQELSLEDYLAEEDYRYKLHTPDDPNDERYETPIVQRRSLYDMLEQQVGMLPLSDLEFLVARQIIGNIDGDGYFRRPITAIVDELAFRQNLSVKEEIVEGVLGLIQGLDPPGVGARDLQECLLLQLHRKPSTPVTRLALKIVEDYFEELSKKHFDRLADRLGIEDDELREVYQFITRLNPRPGESESEVKMQYVVPDFILTEEEGQLSVKLNRKNAPELRVSRNYVRMLQELQPAAKGKDKDTQARETLQFVKAKIDSAQWFIDAIKQRQETLLKTMVCIAEKQKEFFLHQGDETRLRPMILKDVADEIGMDISTVSRVANSKYVQTDFGIYQLKYFFSEGISTDSGEEVSNKEVKRILRELIEGENKKKPLSDDRLTQLLNEKGYSIARRTVAKYREQMDLPVARLRKEI